MAANEQGREWVTAVPKMPRRAVNAHKGDCGRVLVIAGSRGMSGAAILCGSAALRGGAGLVTLACPRDIMDVVAAGNPCYMTTPLEQLTSARLPSSDVIVIGPGLGRAAATAQLVNEMMLCIAEPMVVDADALNLLSMSAEFGGPRVLTPHPGEFARLIECSIADVQANREELALEFSAKAQVVLVLKGQGTLVSDGRRLYRNTTGNPGMATAGSGDVLAGVIGAFIGQGLDTFAAAQLGVNLHGLAGDLARDALGEWSLTAADLLDYLPQAFKKHAGDPL